MKLAKVLILGRPNVGKSTLINRLLKKNMAITYDLPGVTRDLNEFLVTYNSTSFLAVDSGGIFMQKNNEFEFQENVEALVQTAIFEMSSIIFVTDATQGLLPADQKIAQLLRKKVPEKVVVAVNKADNEMLKEQSDQFIKLGLGKPIAISSLHGSGITKMLDRATQGFSSSDQQIKSLEKRFKVGIVGRPNVGKSSLINAIINAEHSIVNEKSGTTRDAIHVFFQRGDLTFEFIDTAGLRRQAKVKGRIEFFSRVRAKKSITQADVNIVVIDAERGFCNQDKRIIQEIIDEGKSMIIFLNKIDALEENTLQAQKDLKFMIVSQMPSLENYPICFGSAASKDGIEEVWKWIPKLFEHVHERIPTKMLNDFNRDVIKRFPPPAKYGKAMKIYYLTQVETLPPTFVCFVNHLKYLTEDYRRFLEKRIRTYLGGFLGHSIKLKFKSHRDEENKS